MYFAEASTIIIAIGIEQSAKSFGLGVHQAKRGCHLSNILLFLVFNSCLMLLLAKTMPC